MVQDCEYSLNEGWWRSTRALGRDSSWLTLIYGSDTVILAVLPFPAAAMPQSVLLYNPDLE
ncbi:hypothetical protein [Egbenema bharatensis]|uniref:hypothetical protein n=1 Tax=Egbenema bharatensis TaxID=3463334 RepID=UPI003A842708